MKIHPKEIENVLKLEPFERYKYFIRKVADFEEFWTIVDDKGDLGVSIVNNKTLISVWTAEDFIKSTLKDNWKNHAPIKMTLDDFEELITPIILENNYLIAVFPVNNKSGFIVTFDEFVKDLNEELEQYESGNG